ncbi:MAG: imidazole glycerol phosphate synthase subunit HisH [Eubacteriales bacterium]|nr:imidazole glycerol phosphate synthase subunit HisH [Eubacteriales bacterium]
MIAIIDYGVGNLFSLKSSLKAIGHEAVVTGDRDIIGAADHVILPGVGAFPDAARKLREAGLFDYVRELAASGKPLLGICLGMQLLFDRSLEFGEHEGLGLIPGEVLPIEDYISSELDIPHMGWNALKFHKESALYKDIPEGTHFYFVHSFAAFGCEKDLSASTEYGTTITASVEKGNVYGTQFHPEKSGEAGLRLLKNFCEL